MTFSFVAIQHVVIVCVGYATPSHHSEIVGAVGIITVVNVQSVQVVETRPAEGAARSLMGFVANASSDLRRRQGPGNSIFVSYD